MAFETKYIFTASMNVSPEKEDAFHEVYDKEHIPMLSAVPGVISIARFKTQELTMILGGERRTIVLEDEPKFSAVYEIESPEVLTTEDWAAAVDKGRWADEVRPFTSNRRHVLRKLIAPRS